MGKFFWIVLTIATGALLAVFLLFAPEEQTFEGNVNPSEITENDHTKGPADAPITLVEYGDFQCPACAQYHPIVERVLEEYNTKVRFVYRHFPLPSHPQAQPAARASEAADRQGKFWEMYNKLYENQTEWAGQANAVSIFERYAQDLGLDMNKYKADIESDEVRQHINRDVAITQELGLSSTPTFFINNERVTLSPTLESFKEIIDPLLQ